MILLETKNLSLGYGKTTVVENLSLKIAAGDFICIVGPNGSGKTTIIKGLLGLISPQKGEIIYNLNRREIGFMPQETKVDPYFPASVLEIVLSGALAKNPGRVFYSKDDKQAALEKLKLLKIENLACENFARLSGGQKQKVLLARALLSSSKLLILDEPSNNLDKTSKDGLYKIIAELNRRERLAIIMVTHDLDHDNLLGDKILSLRDETIFFGSTKEFLKRVHHE
ncbi:metal ABC transporter ATP-binding protein [Candidatus Saccharibacteria bacterium]|nr:metal ABC transporter ATP-binding protein [Candidatus Saccharibacteria bacterium]